MAMVASRHEAICGPLTRHFGEHGAIVKFALPWGCARKRRCRRDRGKVCAGAVVLVDRHKCPLHCSTSKRLRARWCRMDDRKGRRKIRYLPVHTDCADTMAEREAKWDRLEAEAAAKATSTS